MIKSFLTFLGVILFPTCLWAMNSKECDLPAIIQVRNPIAIDYSKLLNTKISGYATFKLLADIVAHGYLLTTEGKFVPEDLSSVTNYFRILQTFSSLLKEDVDRTGFVAVCTECTLKNRRNPLTPHESLGIYKYLFFTLNRSGKSVKNSSWLNENSQCSPFLGRQYSFGLREE